jgi:hypothetical protein
MKLAKTAILLLMITTALWGCKTKNLEVSQTVTAPEILADYDAIKLSVEQEGMYRVSIKDLGWDENTLDNLALTNKDQTVPFWIDDHAGDTNIVFFGEASTSPYTPENIYVVRQDAALGEQMKTVAASQPDNNPAKYVLSTVHLEENHLYVPKVTEHSAWHWVKIIAPQTQTVEFDLENLTDEPGRLRIALWGSTSAPTSPDHHVVIRINGEQVGEAAWDDQAWQFIDTEIPRGILLEGKNTLEIQATGEIEARIDIIDLDWVEIEYPKNSDHLENQELFRVSEEAVQIGNSGGDLSIFEVSPTSEISRLEFPSPTQESLTFLGNPEYRYISVTEHGYRSPSQVLPLTTEPDLHEHSGASYVAIGHPELLAPLAPLLEARTAQGLSTLSLPIEAIYDQFNGGLAEPKAIRAFLAFALENWETPPEYVQLVGDSSYDFYGYQTPVEPNFVPTFLVPTVFGGETGSDVQMVQFGDDLSPKIAIGRVPARTAKQVETFVTKTLDYEETSPGAAWNRSVLAIADGQEASFEQDANHFIEQFSDTFVTQIIAPTAGAAGTNHQIAEEFEKGILLAAYFGHGSVNMWGKDSLFTNEDTASLQNSDHLPVVLNFTCLTGLFTHPTEESLAESLLFNPEGGAVAVLAPTSPTLPGDQTFLSDGLMEGFLQVPIPRLGDITLNAWQQVPTQSPGTLDVMQTFLLFGDPALQIPTP